METTAIYETRKLFDHQTEGVKLAVENPRFGFWWEPGTGKTRTVIEIIKVLGDRALIVAPLSILSSEIGRAHV